MIQINARTFILTYFYNKVKDFNEQQKIVKCAIEN